MPTPSATLVPEGIAADPLRECQQGVTSAALDCANLRHALDAVNAAQVQLYMLNIAILLLLCDTLEQPVVRA